MSEQDNADKGVAADGSMILLKGTEFKSCCCRITKQLAIILRKIKINFHSI